MHESKGAEGRSISVLYPAFRTLIPKPFKPPLTLLLSQDIP